MKKDIHPKYYPDAKIICACGSVLKTGSTQKEMHIEVCSECHPFYTGKKKVMDTLGRVERFRKLTEKSADKKKAAKIPKIVSKKPAKKEARKKK
jgi:large subunit ribosomal protein L31